ncbi:MAG: ribosome small subunit-dependent GTPase A [Clostridiales bacterium]|nr:ribosome small subunit-dependent GTPase A [Clostridiales bacterium]
MIGKIYKILANFYYVKVDNTVYECKAKGNFKNTKTDLAVGDNVEIEIDKFNDEKGNIIKRLDRKNYILRPSVANIDKLIIVISIKKPLPDMVLLDKQIIYALLNNIEPVICINKIDLDLKSEYLKIKETYEKIGYKVYSISTKEKTGLTEIKKEIQNSMCVLSGNSGVGKSSFVNAIFETDIMKEGKISEKISRGKHTTRHIEIFDYENCQIVDTPGFSVFDVLDIKKEELYKYYEEFNEYIDECEYRDCGHIKENRCGIKEAVNENKIDNDRYERYKLIYQELGGKK